MEKLNKLVEIINQKQYKPYLIEQEGRDIIVIDGDSLMATKANTIVEEAGVTPAMFIKMLSTN